MNKQVDIAIIGGGPAGLAAALKCYEQGVKDIVIIERDEHLGGILQQCIHHGFGIMRFKEALTGPEYAQRFIDRVEEVNIPTLLNTMVLDITEDKKITCVNEDQGVLIIEAKSIILAMGCRERTQGALQMAGHRPAGIYPAGMAQKLVNLNGYMPGKEVIILGSGDIGLIMARRMTWEGAHVKMVCELMPYSSGLERNIHQCLNDNDIPLKLSHTIIKIHGKERVEGVTIVKVDENRRPIKETEEFIACDCVLLSVGLIPENELSYGMGITIDERTNGLYVNEKRETNIEGVFGCGNVLHVHDLVDYVSDEAEIAALNAVAYLNENKDTKKTAITIMNGENIHYTVPQTIQSIQDVVCYFRPRKVIQKPIIEVISNEQVILRKVTQTLRPGEMAHFKLTKEVIKKCDNVIVVSVVERNEG